MTDVDRLVRRKQRLTRRLIRRDLRRDKRRFLRTSKPERNRTVLRVRLYKVDLALDEAGWFDA
jgi:hypothetical protein